MTVSTLEALQPALAASSGLAQLFAAAGHRLFLVGGVVRSAVAGRIVAGTDLDCTTDARPDSVRRIVGPVATSVWTQGERFGTIGCSVDGQAFEITTHRAERYAVDSRKPEVAFGDDVIEDLARRDFTVNAMAVDIADGALIDPYGGRDDLAAGVLRTPLDPAVSFSDDPLRMLRAARFIAGHDLVPASTLTAAVEAMADRLEIVAVERVRDEFEKLLLLDDPSAGFSFLSATGLIERVMAELAQRDLVATAGVTAAAAPQAAPRWASLFVRDTVETATACLRRLRCSNELIASATALLAARARLAEISSRPGDVRRFVYSCGVPVDAAVEFAEAVAKAAGEPAERIVSFGDALAELRRTEDVDNFALPVDGGDIMALLGLDPGPEVGRALAFLRQRAFENGPSSKADAVRALHQWRAANYCGEA